MSCLCTFLIYIKYLGRLQQSVWRSSPSLFRVCSSTTQLTPKGVSRIPAHLASYAVKYSFTPTPPTTPPHPPPHPPPHRSDRVRRTPKPGGRVRGLSCLSCHTYTIRCPPAPVGPSHACTQSYGRACLCASMCTLIKYSFTPTPPTTPSHPPSSPCHIVTHTTLVTQGRFTL